MNEKLKDISQISIYIKNEAERVNEVALFHPLNKKTRFDDPNKAVFQRKWDYAQNLSLIKKLTLKVQSFLFRHIPFLIPQERQSKEAKFKTVLALLLSQETLREFFLNHSKQRDFFFKALLKTAESIGYLFEIPEGSTPIQISRNLTHIEGKASSLIDDEAELNLQISTLNYFERNEILFKILNEIERPPIQSVLEITHGELIDRISLVTKYAKYKIMDRLKEGKFSYTFEENQATSSIRTIENTRPDALGTMNQRYVFDENENEIIGAYSGELTSPKHVLEQVLLILNQKNKEGWILDAAEKTVTERKILFTSLYSWHEFDSIKDQHESIHYLDQKILKSHQDQFKMHLLHFNIPFNALNKYPSPEELGANIEDVNDESLIRLTYDYFTQKGISSEELSSMIKRLDKIRRLDFLKRQQYLLAEIDSFRQLKKSLLSYLPLNSHDLTITCMHVLLTGKKPNGKNLKGMDKLIYLDVIAKYLGYFHSKNCKNSTDRSAGANAADKAQYAFRKCLTYPFLPAFSNDDETALFKVFYSMYLVWEEPEITTALSTGFLGEKFYNNFLQKNPETTKYLIEWLKKHPEVYLGLSDYRS